MELPDQSDNDTYFVALLTAHQSAMQLYIRSLLPGEPASGDVVQQTNAKLWERRDDFELGTNFKAWAFRIARFEVLNYRKRKARDARLVFSGELDEVIAHELANGSMNLQEQHAALQECLEKLRPQDRQLLLHRYSNRGSLADFAQSVGRSVGGLKVTLHRLRSALLICMQRRLGTEEATR